MANSYRRIYILPSKNVRKYAHLVFCLWDYQISTEKAAVERNLYIAQEARRMLNENQDITIVTDTIFDKIKALARTIIYHFLVALVICGGGLIMSLSYKKFKERIKSELIFIGLMGLLLKLCLWIIIDILKWISR